MIIFWEMLRMFVFTSPERGQTFAVKKQTSCQLLRRWGPAFDVAVIGQNLRSVGPRDPKPVVPAWKNRFFFVEFIFLNVLRLETFFFFFFSRGSFVFLFLALRRFCFLLRCFFLIKGFFWGGFFKSKGGNIAFWGCWEWFYIQEFFSNEGDVTCVTIRLFFAEGRLFTLWSLCGGKLFLLRGDFCLIWRFFLLRGDLLNWEENIFCWGRIIEIEGGHIYFFLFWRGGEQFLVWGNTSE